MNLDYPILNGIAPSWADISIRATTGVAILDIKDISAIKTSSTVEVGEQRGASGGRVMKRTTGAVSHEASITLYRDGYRKLVASLAALAPRRGLQSVISAVSFGIHVQHTPPGEVLIYEYRIKGCRIIGRSLDAAEGSDAEVIEVPLSVLEIVDVIGGVEVALL